MYLKGRFVKYLILNMNINMGVDKYACLMQMYAYMYILEIN